MKPSDKMTDEEIQERMNQLYREYTLYWTELAKRRKKKRSNENTQRVFKNRISPENDIKRFTNKTNSNVSKEHYRQGY